MRPLMYSRVRCPGRATSAPRVRGSAELMENWSSSASISMRPRETCTSTFRCPQARQKLPGVGSPQFRPGRAGVLRSLARKPGRIGKAAASFSILGARKGRRRSDIGGSREQEGSGAQQTLFLRLELALGEGALVAQPGEVLDLCGDGVRRG